MSQVISHFISSSYTYLHINTNSEFKLGTARSVGLGYTKCTVLYITSYHAIENTANQNAGKLLYIHQYSIIPSHQSLQFNSITPKLPIVLATVISKAWYKIVMQPFLVVNREISHLSLVFFWGIPRYTTRMHCITSTYYSNIQNIK